MRSTPENISEIGENEVFVFGSNLNGHHYGGAAKLAHEKFGAEWGKGIGLMGRCYAFPTLDMEMRKIPLHEWKIEVEALYFHAMRNPEKTFLVTKLGCGIAGFSEEEVRPFFGGHPENVVLPKGW